MSNSLTALTALSVAVFRDRHNPKHETHARLLLERMWMMEPAFTDAQLVTLPATTAEKALLADATAQVFAESDLVTLRHRDGELDPMFLSPGGGGGRMNPEGLITGLLTAAFLRMHYLRLPSNEGTFVRTVLEGFDELRQAVRGERIRGYRIFGITGVTLPEGAQVSMPWGVLRAAPPSRTNPAFLNPWQSKTDCVLADARLWPITIDRAAQPQTNFDPAEISDERPRILFPLACALASSDTADPVVPLVTWSTQLLPFQTGFGFSSSLQIPRFKQATAIDSRIAEVEEWARIVDESHTRSVEVAVKRLVSAAAQRLDRADALIDAVMAWENLVGTSQETTFRVTAAIARALESDRTKRRSFRKSLAETYGVRSRVVHGEVVDPSSVNSAASQAIDVAIRVLRLSYKKGRQWLELSSTERADSLILEEP
jgi:hypothetical protein